MINNPDIDKESIQRAVDVARWMRLVPVLESTPYGAARLVWQYKGNYLEFIFLKSEVRILFCPKGQLRNLYVGAQHFDERILIDMLYTEVVKFAVVSGLETPVLEAWDQLDGTKIEDIDMVTLEEREKAAYNAMINMYRSLQHKEVKEDVTEQSSIDETASESDDIVVEAQ